MHVPKQVEAVYGQDEQGGETGEDARLYAVLKRFLLILFIFNPFFILKLFIFIKKII
jgi:hypothetical protein